VLTGEATKCRTRVKAMQPARATAIFLITGPMAAGKSTVARLLAERFERGVYLEGDLFRRSIVSGRVEMTPNASAEAVEQLHLRYRLAAAAADAYWEAGFTVALEDIVAGESLGDYRTMIRGRPCHVIVLMPSRDAIGAREARRVNKGYTVWTVEELYEGFAATTPRVGLWLDTSDQAPEETVDEILARTASVSHPVVVSDYDPAWPAVFRQIAEPVERALREIAVAVEHVGSTAVPGLAAKPVIDVDVVVGAAGAGPPAHRPQRDLGYVYQGDKGIADRDAFMWPPHAPRHHLYVVIEGSKPHSDHIRFRDYLRKHPEEAREYGEFKRRLAEQHGNDRASYTDAKAEFIARVLARREIGH
jgi:GrpB-like predicted nucleotidyltransferase (UPF0157 family)/chloramphenicol 3-O-phosphotransferase